MEATKDTTLSTAGCHINILALWKDWNSDTEPVQSVYWSLGWLLDGGYNVTDSSLCSLVYSVRTSPCSVQCNQDAPFQGQDDFGVC